MKPLLSLFLALSLGLFSAKKSNAADLQVAAAASLTDALTALAPAFEKETGDKVIFNFAGSNVLARQIQEGAPVDVFISADEAKMSDLVKAGLVEKQAVVPFLSNTLVIVAPTNSDLKILNGRQLVKTEVKHLALAQPDSVPAGIYAKEYLEKVGIWNQLKSRVVPTENVRAALAAVESENAEAGIVYKTDAEISHKVKVLCEISQKEGPHIVYPVAVISASKNKTDAEKFIAFLRSKQAEAKFSKMGFIILK
ncbi:MAG: molybdate ABC transporter substrate-binding protein [Chthoniobacterales bacterium]